MMASLRPRGKQGLLTASVSYLMLRTKPLLAIGLLPPNSFLLVAHRNTCLQRVYRSILAFLFLVRRRRRWLSLEVVVEWIWGRRCRCSLSFLASFRGYADELGSGFFFPRAPSHEHGRVGLLFCYCDG